MSHTDLIVGNTYEVKYPFIREDVELFDGEGYSKTKSWRPGIRAELMPPEGDAEYFADGEGLQMLTVVSLHKPGKFPERVFYTRQWQAPDGRVFGKKKLFIAVASKFNRLRSGYPYGYKLEAA